MYKKILTIQDVSCVGQCSLTVALPILSACGHETAILPSAVLSTHTAGFSGYTFRDLTKDIEGIRAHWVKENIKFDAIYTGYLGSTEQIDLVKSIISTCSRENAKIVVDPAMADNGKLYPGFDEKYVSAMKSLVAVSDYVVPNITEACMLTGVEYKTEYSEEYIADLVVKLLSLGAKNVILTGVSYKANKTGVVVVDNGRDYYYEHDKLENSCHGTGDIYASAFVGALLKDKSAYESAKIAADYTVSCIKETATLDNHWYGAAFEPVLGELINMVK